MENDIKRLHEILREGKCCAVALVQVALESKAQQNDQLLQAVRGLCGGVQGGLVCGALTGAACAMNVLSPEHANDCMVPELTEWFVHAMGEAYGGSNCEDILAGEPMNKATRCSAVVEATYLQIKTILESYEHTLN